MTNEQFLQQFGHFIDAPNGIQKLREMILQLAVRGKLMEQDAEDEPASILLEKTLSTKAKLVKKKEIRKTKVPALPNDEPPNKLPSSWIWTNLYEIGEIGPRNEADDDADSSFVPMQLISDNYGTPVQHEVKPWKDIKSGFTHFREEDVVLAKITPCFQNGKSTVMRGLTNGLGAGTTELHVYRAIDACTVPEYVLIYLKSPGFILGGIPKMTGTAGQKRITRDYFAGNHFPLPPLAEQHRIVARVDELMALCDQLEGERNTREATHQRLIRAVHHPLTASDSDNAHYGIDNLPAWHRIRDNFADLYTTLESVQALRQTILQLAVQGKLVEQDPNDEHASALLETLGREIEESVKSGKIKKQKTVSPLNENDMPFPIPSSWAWVKIGGLLPDYQNGASSRGDKEGKEVTVLRLADIKDWKVSLANTRSLLISESSINKYRLKKDDMLLIRVNGSADIVGRFILCEDDYDAIYCDHFIRMRLPTFVINPSYLKLLGASSLIRGKIQGLFVSTAGQKTINQKHISSLAIALPPHAEQHRIVANVDELMALCDQLETNIRDKNDTATRYAEAVVNRIAAA